MRSTSFAPELSSLPRKTPGAYVRAVLESLAFKYRLVIGILERVTRKAFRSDSDHRRRLEESTAEPIHSGCHRKKSLAGPAEATALGNIAMQILATGGAASLSEVRAIIDRSFPTEIFEPLETDKWEHHAERFQQYCESIYA